MTLNTLFITTWRDWRLSYAEGGVGCWSASAGVQVASGTPADVAAALPGLTASLMAFLVTAWGCASATDCAASTLPAGVLPSAKLSLSTERLTLTVFPALPAANTAALSAAASSALAAASVGSLLLLAGGGAFTWDHMPVPCQGANARRLPASLTLGSGQANGADPSTADGPHQIDTSNMGVGGTDES